MVERSAPFAAGFLTERRNILALARDLSEAGRHRAVIKLARKFTVLFDEHSLWDEWREVALLGLRAARASDDTVNEARFLVELSSIASEKGDFQPSLGHAEAARRLARAADARGVLGDAEAALGNAYQRMGRDAESVAHFEAAREHYAASGTSAVVAEKALNNLANARLALGDVHSATATYSDLLAARQARGDAIGAANVLVNLSEAALTRGDGPSAIAYAQRAITAYAAAGLRRELGMAIANKGQALRLLGRTEEAAQQYSLAIDIFDEVGDEVSGRLAREYLSRVREGTPD